MNSIEIRDNFLEEADAKRVLEYCFQSLYHYGECDMDDTPPTGMVHEIEEDEDIYRLFESKIKNYYRYVKKLNLDRMYVNCFAPSENPYFHTDGEEGITFLYYPNMNWDLQEGGETQFYINDDIYGITPVPNRIVIFSANIKHKATTFRNNHRFTVAVKYT